MKDYAINSLEEDRLKMGNYVNGLSKFINTCDTPMTIAIQGDWGTGKSSMMNMIKRQIEDEVYVVEFNTWQFSQFGMEEELSIALLEAFVQQLPSISNKAMEKVTQSLKTVGRVMSSVLKKAVVIGVDKVVGQEASASAKNVLYDEEKNDCIKCITDLKNQLQDLINNLTENDLVKRRIVVFIDYLDRFNPARAVELLEVLKIFLDCEKCVFLLAVDYSVVSQGIKEKYGDLIVDEKAKQFFDKIIQVPFSMPVITYDLSEYIVEGLRDVGVQAEDRLIYEELVKASVGNNPRSIKRLINMFKLQKLIMSPHSGVDVSEDAILFGILCLQYACPEIYEDLVSNMDRYIENIDNFFDAQIPNDDTDIVNILKKVILKEGIYNKEQLMYVLQYSKTTGTSLNSTLDKDYKANKEIAKSIKVRVESEVKEFHFTIAKRKDNSEASFYHNYKMEYGYMYTIRDAINGKEMLISLYPRKNNNSLEIVKNKFGENPFLDWEPRYKKECIEYSFDVESIDKCTEIVVESISRLRQMKLFLNNV